MQDRLEAQLADVRATSVALPWNTVTLCCRRHDTLLPRHFLVNSRRSNGQTGRTFHIAASQQFKFIHAWKALRMLSRATMR